MIRFQALGTRFSLPPLALLAPLLGSLLGMKGLAETGVALAIHEIGHVAAARIARVEIREIRLMPFGGSARMENPYGLPGTRLFIVAAAGPAANLLLMFLCASLAQWNILDPARAAALVRPSAVLMLFNLLPALPLDGGRMLFALLQRSIRREQALRIGLILGRALGISLIGAALFLRFHIGKWNLSFLLAALFILCSGRDERQALLKSRAQQYSRSLSPDSAPLPVRICQLDGQTPASEALRLIRPGEGSWFVVTEGGLPAGLIDGGSILRQIMDASPDTALSRLRLYPLQEMR